MRIRNRRKTYQRRSVRPKRWSFFSKWFSGIKKSSASVDQPIRRRFTVIVIAAAMFSFTIITKAVFVQIFTDPRLERLAKRQFHSRVLVRPRRGMIVDRNNEPLAVNLETQSLAANPQKISNRSKLIKHLSRSTGISQRRLSRKLSGKKEFVWIKRHLTESQLESFRRNALLDADGDLLEGLWLVKENRREYPQGKIASHIIGDVNVDSEGLEGIELRFNDHLKGEVVAVKAIKDALRRPTFIDAVAAGHVRDGKTIRLTIDTSLQYSVESALESAVKKHQAKAGTVIVMNAENGEILALANRPTFSPKQSRTPPSHRRNRAVTDAYEPGSTAKPLLVAAALSAGWSDKKLIWGGRGQLRIQNRTISEAEAHEKFEWLTLRKIIEVSSNVGSAKIALELGSEKWISFLRMLGFGEKTGIEFPGEVSAWLPSPRTKLQPITLANMGFGQGFSSTPLQMTRAYAALINGGRLVTPRLVLEEEEPQSSEVKKSAQGKKVLAPSVAQRVVRALASSVATGTGTRAQVKGYRIAGKTGTAQKIDPQTKRYSKTDYASSFIGFAVDVDPKIVIYTLIDRPQGRYYASETAAPLFQEVFKAVANRFRFPSRLDKGEESAPLAKSQPVQKSPPVLSRRNVLRLAQFKEEPKTVFQWKSKTQDGQEVWKVPDLRGLSAREILKIVKNHEFELKLMGFGTVKNQLPLPGAVIKDGQTLKLTLKH